MTRREWLQAAALAPLKAAAQRPDVVLFVADDLGSGDLLLLRLRRHSHAEHRLDRHARRAFTLCYVNGPECTPTRAVLLTGRYQHRVGGLECAIGVGRRGSGGLLSGTGVRASH